MRLLALIDGWPPRASHIRHIDLVAAWAVTYRDESTATPRPIWAGQGGIWPA